MNKPQFITERLNESSSHGTFVISPLPAGFGSTIGNGLRRTLLSSIGGAAVTYVKINDVVHPFSIIKGVKESVLDIILNIKLLRFKTVGEGPFEMSISKKGIQRVTGADFKKGDIEVVNKNQHITEITADKTKLEITLIIEKGTGYSQAEEKEKKEFGMLALDSVFSPVSKVNYSVEPVRVGRKTNFDKFIVDIWTDGTITPHNCLKEAAGILSEYFGYILSGKDVKEVEEEKKTEETVGGRSVDKKVYQTIIDELDLPTRVINALLREKIETVEDLIKRGKNGLVGLKGLGEKSLDLVEKELEKLGIPF
ncbi:MAG TPA: DNA-directed RNA polymerase subunit alpha [Patescibacteria group bacterium]|nr:DNA-directed RNA polymerase subunit alpha [Patescibacteria group bacterium]